MKNLFLLLIISLLSLNVSAQESNLKLNSKDVVFLKDGSTLRGTVTEQVPDEYILITIAGGTETKILMSQVKRIKKDSGKYSFYKDGSSVRNKGIYKSFMIQGMLGRSEENRRDDRMTIGAGAQYAIGYQFNKYFSLGVGIGLEQYDALFGDAYVQARVYLPNNKVSPMIALDAGYGVPVVFSGNNGQFDQVKGGLSLRPSIGLRIATRNRSDVTLSVGNQFQNYYQKSNWGWGTIDEFRVWYRRLSFRVGWTF